MTRVKIHRNKVGHGSVENGRVGPTPGKLNLHPGVAR